MRSKRKIAILACLSSLNPSYSIAGVVQDQLNLLKKFNEDLIFITTDDFKDHHLVPKGVEVKTYSRYKGSLDNIDMLEFEQYVFETSSILRNYLRDVTHVIQHDLLFIHSFVAINWSIRECAKLLPKLKWLHWQHSAPSSKPKNCEYPLTGCYLDMPNSKFVYLNRTDVSKVAEMYGTAENNIAVVHNFIDFEKLFKVHPITSEILDKFDLLKADTIGIYPTRLTEAKQIDKLIKIFESLKETQTVKLIICNTYSNADKEKEYLKALLSQTTLTDTELLFTSTFKSNWCKDNNHNIELGVPREVVSDLLRLSDLFVLPSTSECCSMIMLEAAANKNLMILNDDLWSLQEFGGQKIEIPKSTKAMYLEFGSVTRPIGRYLPSEEAWYKDKADMISKYQNHNQAINFFKYVRKKHNPKWVYYNQILPLLLD